LLRGKVCDTNGSEKRKTKKVIALLGYWVIFVSSVYGAVFFYQEPNPYVMTVTSIQQTQPPLDISGIAEIQSIPVGGVRAYRLNTTQGISMRTILDSIANLAVMQFDVEGYTIKAVNPYTKQEEIVVGGEFGRILRHEILGFDPRVERGLRVEHIEFVQTPGLTPKFDEDIFELWINARQIGLVLARDMGRPDKGFPEWGC
jgi:hypothetical protein